MKIFLIGMMGSGKTYWAEKLKSLFELPAYDLDHLLESQEGKTISDIFAQHGEENFRKSEAKMLRTFKEKNRFILSCGGGTPCYNNNMDWMNENGITIWLNEPVEILAERLIVENKNRPLIKDLSLIDLKNFLSNQLVERQSYYNQATHTLAGDAINEESFTQILKENA